MNIEIREIGHAIAYTSYKKSGDPYIAVNRNLFKYSPRLYQDVIEHERAHINSGNKVIDLQHELSDFFMFKKNLKLFMFMLSNPKSMTALFPFVFEINGEFEIKINVFMCIMWTLLGLIIWSI